MMRTAIIVILIFLFGVCAAFAGDISDDEQSADGEKKKKEVIYQYKNFKLGISKTEYLKAIDDFSEEKVSGAWYIEDDLGSWYYQLESGGYQADFNHGRMVFLTGTEPVIREKFDNVLVEFKSKYGEHTDAPPEFAMKFGDFKMIKMAAEYEEFYIWSDADTEQVLILGYYKDPERLYFCLADIKPAVEFDKRRDEYRESQNK